LIVFQKYLFNLNILFNIFSDIYLMVSMIVMDQLLMFNFQCLSWLLVSNWMVL